MKNNTLKALGIATLMVAGFNIFAVAPVSLVAAQSYRQVPIPRQVPAPVPAPRPAPAPAPRSAPAPAPAPRSAPAPAPAPRSTPAPAPAPRSAPAPAPAPRSTPAPAPTSTQRPARTPAPQHQSTPAPQQQPSSESQRQSTAAQQHPAAQPAQHTSQTPQTHQTAPNVQHQQQNQKEQQKVQQRQQQEQARQQKQAQKAEQKQQQQKAKEQKQQQKQQEKQQKEQAKAQAKQQKQQEKMNKKLGKSATSSTSTRPITSSAASSLTNSASSGKSLPVASTSKHASYSVPGGSAVATKTATGSVLTHDASRNVISQVNADRSSMKGINSKPLPAGDVTVHQNGSLTVKASGGRQYGVRANGTISSVSASGKTASFNAKGKVTAVHTPNMDVRHSANGLRTVVAHRADNTTVVATGRHSGYVERTVVHNNQTYVQRSVVVGNRIVTNTYVSYGFGGVALTHFVSPVFYSPTFYGWAYYPWVNPVAFTFGWFGEPWYLGPHPYFAAFGVYPSASFWLTDYFLGQTLATAYHEHQDSLADDDGDLDSSADASMGDDDYDSPSVRASFTTPITPELKAAIADEVKEQIAAENTAATHPDKAASYGELPSIIGKRNHVFVVANNLDVTTIDQQACSLQAGDVLQLTVPPSDAAPQAQLRVASSKRLDCPAGVQVAVSISDLQEMQNNLRAQIASGLGTLEKSQGKGGLPAAPPEALSTPPRPAIAGIEPMPSAQIMSTIDQQVQQADALEREAEKTAFDGPTQN